MLETRRVGGVAGDRYVYVFVLHYSYAFNDVVCAEYSYFASLAVGVGYGVNHFELACEVIKLCLYVSKSVDSADYLSRVLAKSVEDNLERLFSYFVCLHCNTDRAFCCGKRFVTCEECKALGLFSQKHSRKISVSKSDLSLFSDRTGYAEALQADTDCLSSVSRLLATLFDSDSATYGVCPYCIFKCDRLNSFDDSVYVDALVGANLFCFFKRGYAVFFEALGDFVYSS